MFCPRCGSSLVSDREDTFVCARTGASFGAEYFEELEGYSLSADEPRPARPVTCDPEGSWFCTDCGCAMLATPGFVTCPRCGKGLNGFVNALSKTSPHP